MLGKLVLIFQVIIIILYGIFIRTDTTSSIVFTSISPMLLFIVSYIYLQSKHRSLDWTILTNFLLILSLVFQINILYHIFWQEAFAQLFTTTTSISSALLISSAQATLVIVVTITPFVSRMSHLQIFIVAMLQSFGYALNWSICRWGIQAVTSGGASTIWLFGFLYAAAIKKIKYDEVIMQVRDIRYFTRVLQVFALGILVILWPSFNSTTTELDLTVANLSADALLVQQAYLQTWLGLFSCVATTLSLRIIGEKMLIEKIILSIVNTGILISSSACFIIDPFASLLMGMIGPILCFAYDRYAIRLHSMGYPFDSIFMAFMGGVFSAIFSGGRNGRTPLLSSDPLRQGGLQFSMTLVSILFAILFGVITGLLLRCTGSQSLEQTDMAIWQIQPSTLPLYHDDPKLQKLYRVEDRERLQVDQAQFSLKQRYISSQIKQVNEGKQQGKVIRQQVQYSSRLSIHN